jgi:hypothetical protein
MESLAALKPTTKLRIMDIVETVGIDVSAWKASGASNPKYCYQWGFINEAKDRLVLCLWYDDCEVDDQGIHQKWNFREYIRQMEQDGGPKAGRARKVDELLQDAWRLGVPIHVAIVDETDAKKARSKPDDTSEAAYRELDPVQWRVAEYDWMSGACVLRRGLLESAVSKAPVDAIPDTAPFEQHPMNLELAQDLAEQLARTDVPATTRDALVAARVGQGAFRASLIKVWGGACAVTGCAELSVLRASHIQPWRHSDDRERLDFANGLLLTANLDALFDAGLITFEDDGRMVRSPNLKREVAGVSGSARLRGELGDAQKRYLDFHRRTRFQKKAG